MIQVNAVQLENLNKNTNGQLPVDGAKEMKATGNSAEIAIMVVIMISCSFYALPCGWLVYQFAPEVWRVPF